MGLRSKKDSKDPNTNKVHVKIGQNEYWQDLASLTLWDSNDIEYSLKDLFEKILTLESENKKLKAALKEYVSVQKTTDNLIVKAADLLSLKVSQLESDVKDIKKEI